MKQEPQGGRSPLGIPVLQGREDVNLMDRSSPKSQLEASMAALSGGLLVDVFSLRPETAAEFYRMTGGPALPEYDEITLCRHEPHDQTHCGRGREEGCALAVFRRDGAACFGVLFDMVGAPNAERAETWTCLLASARRRLDCLVALVVLCSDRATGKWAAAASAVGDLGCFAKPLVVSGLV